MTIPADKLNDFVTYVRTHLTGDEKGEAHLFCDRLMQAFGHKGIKEAGGSLEFRVQQGNGTKFADLLWRPRLLLEMKKRGEGVVLPTIDVWRKATRHNYSWERSGLSRQTPKNSGGAL